MKASELVRQLQEGIAEGRDWEIVCSETHTPLHEVTWHMPSLQEREDYDAQPFITVEQNWSRDQT